MAAYHISLCRGNRSKLTYTILHEYGHVLPEDETQMDLSVGTNTHDPAGFMEGSFRMRYDEPDMPALRSAIRENFGLS